MEVTFIKRRKGQTQLTYSLVLVLVAIAAIIAVMLCGRVVQGLLSDIHSKFSSIFPGAPTTVEEEGESSEEPDVPPKLPRKPPQKPPGKPPVKPKE